MATHDRARLGISQLLWGFDLSRPDRLIQFLDEASQIGYQGVLLFDTTLPFWSKRPGELKKLLTDRRLELVGTIHRSGLDFAGTRAIARMVAELGGERLVLSARDGRQEDWEIVMPLLRRHGEIAAEYGLRTVYHHHTNWIAETMEQYERLLADVDRRSIGVMLDCGHATKDFTGHSALEFYEKHNAEVEYVEFKDYSPETDLRTEVGRGQCDFPAIAASLRRHGYAGWIVVEQNGTTRTPKESAAESYRYIRETLGL